MPAKFIQVGRVPVAGVPSVKTPQCVAAPTFLRGYPVVVDQVSGLLDECGADPAFILGFALQDNSTNPGFSAANSPATITGRNNTASVAVANDATEFMGPLVNGNDTIVAPVDADRFAQYGLTKYNNVWYLDKLKLGASARCVVTGIDTANNRVLFKVLKAYQQEA